MKTALKAIELFKRHHAALAEMIAKDKAELESGDGWNQMVEQAAGDLKAWQSGSARKQAYTPESLANARLAREAANYYSTNHMLELIEADALHQAQIAYEIISSGFDINIAEEGTAGRKFGIVELSARLVPALTFPGSSDYFEIGYIPYGKQSREIVGEKTAKGFVSQEVARASAENLIQNFKVHYSLAETSAAPRSDVPKSGKKPEIHICALVGNETFCEEHHTIETPFRPEFNSIVREMMYATMIRMYRNKK